MSDGWFLYVEPFSGASGDMLLGAMLGLGVPVEVPRLAVSSLGLEGWTLELEAVHRAGLAASRAIVTTSEDHHHRGLPEIEAMLDTLPTNISEKCRTVFRRLAQAEAEAHGIPTEQVHFHEVGAADALIDVVGFVGCLAHLGIEELYCGAFPVGEGVIRCAHGQLPNPAPATMRLLSGWPMRAVGESAELVTPTGAALLTALGQPGRPPGLFTLETSALGAGARDLETANVLRASLGWCSHEAGWEMLSVLECHLDDITGELLGYTMERLFEEGALEVSFEALTMKKSRPGHRLWVLCRPAQDRALAGLLFAETTTLGVRRSQVERWARERDFVELTTPYGTLKAKRTVDDQGRQQLSPEYDDARRLARQAGVPLRLVFEAAARSGLA